MTHSRRCTSPYSTGEGQTAKIAEYIADVMRTHGHEAQTTDIGRSEDPLPSGYEGVIVGASIHMGKHDKHAVGYVRNNRTALEQLPSARVSAPHPLVATGPAIRPAPAPGGRAQ